MKVVFFASSLMATVLLAAGAPAVSNEPVKNGHLAASEQRPQNRVKRSEYGLPPSPPPYGHPPSLPPYGHPSYGGHASLPSYGPPPSLSYVAPCGGAPLSYFHPAPAHPSYGYGAPHGYGGPHYRADEFGEADLMNFPDNEFAMSEHTPMARFNYGIPAVPGGPIVGSSHLGSGSTSAFSGISSGAAGPMPAFGVFPNANVGGCNVPLLLSCSPSITSGRLIKGYADAPVPAASSSGSSVVNAGNYRGVDEQLPLDSHNEHLEEQTHSKFNSKKDSTHNNDMK